MQKAFALMLVSLLFVSTFAASVASAQGDMGQVNFVNFVGEELHVTVDGLDAYVVPGSDTVPEGGRLELTLSTGTHDFSLAIPRAPGQNMIVDVLEGGSDTFGVVTEAVAADSSRHEKVLLKVFAMEEPAAGEPVAGETPFAEATAEAPAAETTAEAPTAEPTAEKAAAEPTAEADTETPASEPAVAEPVVNGNLATVVITNYIGEPLTFTTGGVSTIVPAAGGEVALIFDPGLLDYTMNVPAGMGADNTLELLPGAQMHLSCVLLYDPNDARYTSADNMIQVFAEVTQ